MLLTLTCTTAASTIHGTSELPYVIGTKISHYRVLEKLGEGGMGEVYVAEDLLLGRTVALKTLPQRFAQDPARRKRFQSEARAAAALSHAAIAAVYELIEDGDDLYIAMELVRGESLRTLVKIPPIPSATLLDIAVQIAAGMAAAHAAGIVHRDLKPENIMCCQSGTIKILDFGLAKCHAPLAEAMTQSGNTTGSGMMMGTVAYMSPEQLEARPTDARTDIFAAGSIMYELATGSHPFGGGSAASTIANILTLEPPPLPPQSGSISPAELERIINKCLRKDRDNRYQSARELLMDLEALRQAAKAGRAPRSLPEKPAETIVRRALQPVGPSPRRWWEMNAYCCIISFPAIAYWVWRVREWLPHEWAALIFFGMVLLVSSSMTMRLYLLMMSGFNPTNLHTEVVRWATALRFTTLGIWILLATVAVLIVRQHLGIGSLMGGIAVGGWLSTTVGEVAIDKHAFPR
jgi:serine/threonine protein kinase